MSSLSCVLVLCLVLGFLVDMFVCLLYLFFFFKQKTAYEMRISDWSSDVCSSDLVERRRQRRGVVEADRLGRLALGESGRRKARGEKARHAERHHLPRRRHMRPFARPVAVGGRQRRERRRHALPKFVHLAHRLITLVPRDDRGVRSEEHTSELQSLMRI